MKTLQREYAAWLEAREAELMAAVNAEDDPKAYEAALEMLALVQVELMIVSPPALCTPFADA